MESGRRIADELHWTFDLTNDGRMNHAHPPPPGQDFHPAGKATPF